MPITEKQRERRKNYLGASDASAVLGLDPYRSPADVYYSKVQDLDDIRVSEAALIGNVIENSILDWFANDRGIKIIKNQFRVHENKIMSASLDALVVDAEEAVEAKTAGLLHPFDREEWGEVGTDQIPERYIIQCQHQMSVLGPKVKKVWVPVLLGGVGLRNYVVYRNQELINLIEEKEDEFWKSYVIPCVQPSECLPSLETIKRIRRETAKSVELDASLISDWLEAKTVLNEAKKFKEEKEKSLLAALGDAEVGECELGKLTYLEQRRGSYQVKETTFRVPRFKKTKETKQEVVHA